MVEKPKIRVSKEFLEMLKDIRARYYMYQGKMPSFPELTKIIARKINKESLYEDEINKK